MGGTQLGNQQTERYSECEETDTPRDQNEKVTERWEETLQVPLIGKGTRPSPTKPLKDEQK